jgi:16S rRNA (guanine527-N7)-methyltransferase
VKPLHPPTATTPDERSTWNGVDPRRIAAAEALLRAGLAELGFNFTAEQIEALLRLAALLERWAQGINLSSHRDVEAIVGRLILDAAALSRCLPPAAGLVDLGSGAGFPGLPIAVLRPECMVLLVEARERRHHFQKAAVRELGLRNVEAICGRAEQLEPQPRAIALGQAMARPAQAVRWMKPWAQVGGWLALPGGESPPQIDSEPDVVAEPAVAYVVPCGGPRRTLWLGRRVS